MKTLYCGIVVVGVTGYLLPESRRLQSSQPPAGPHLSMSIKNMILTLDSLAYLLFIVVFNNIQGTDRDHLLSTHHYSTCNMDLCIYRYMTCNALTRVLYREKKKSGIGCSLLASTPV